MKVLVISLLRLGDFIQTLPVIGGLKTQFPVKRLDVLTFEPAKSLHPMLGDVDHWWTLNRDELQSGLGRGEIPLLTSFSVLREKLDEISAVDYDCVINLTHTHFSGWISGYISAKRRIGLAMDAKSRAFFHSPWFQYLDDHAQTGAKDMFHYTDIFFHGCGLKGSERQWRMKETRAGREEAGGLTSGKGERIVVQLLTSDAKKNWAAESWIDCLAQLQVFRPAADFVFLCAPGESAAVTPILEQARRRGIKAEKAVLSLAGAFSLLKNSALLITGDTSIKHLANAARIKILELSLGSSDWRRTGAYAPDSLILQPRIACAPCPHSAACSRPTHECAEQLEPALAAAAAHQYISGDWNALALLAREYLSDVSLMRTLMTSGGFWMTQELCETRPRAAIESLLERSTWRFLLNQEHQRELPQFGSEGVRLKLELARLLPFERGERINEHLHFIETNSARPAAVAETPVQARGPMIDITDVRRQACARERAHSLSEIKLKLIRALKTQLTESR